MAEFYNELQENKGKITCDRNILLSIISLATKEISGVSALVDKRFMKLKKLISKSHTTGVKLKRVGNGQLVIDVYIKIFNRNNVPDIAYRVQENIKNNIVSMVEMRVSKINVHIVGVDFIAEEQQQL